MSAIFKKSDMTFDYDFVFGFDDMYRKFNRNSPIKYHKIDRNRH